MERRNFLKGIFGAAVVAAMPEIVVRQIEELPEPIPISPAVNGVEPVFIKEYSGNNMLYIYDKEKLIGYSTKFSLTLSNFIDVENELDQDYSHYYSCPMKREWNLIASEIDWLMNPQELFANQETLNYLINYGKEGLKIVGNTYISGLNWTTSMNGLIYYDAQFEGIEVLIICPK